MTSLETRSEPWIRWGQSGQTLVFLHYFGGSAASWKWVAEFLQSDHQCIALNLAGFGETSVTHPLSLQGYADAVQAQIQQLGLQSYTLIGHSMGGKIALKVAADQAPGLERVILIAPSPATQEPMPPEEKERLLSNHPSRENAIKTIESATEESLSSEQHELAIWTHTVVEQEAWRWWLLEGMEESIADQVARIQVPVLVIASTDDPVIPYKTIQSDVVEKIEHCQKITTKGVGHLLPLEEPEFIAYQIRHALQ